MFQYFIKIVPTSYKGKKLVKEIQRDFDMSKEPLLETNRYFVTERFTPLVEVDEEDWEMGMLVSQDDDEQGRNSEAEQEERAVGETAESHVVDEVLDLAAGTPLLAGDGALFAGTPDALFAFLALAVPAAAELQFTALLAPKNGYPQDGCTRFGRI